MVLYTGAHEAMTERVRRTREDLTILPVPESNHFQLITPTEDTWDHVVAAVRMALGME
ncbi:MAG: hypothetical protein KJO11_06795 [Gemmatimonadetes bacterium]|nr:hypothetical protein [Gemmatimonadota bacterium]